MRRTISVLLVVLVLAVMPSVALAYEWGQYDLGGNTVYPTDRSWMRSRSGVRSTPSQPLTEPL